MTGAASTVNPLLVVDAANVVGSVPDGWWRDRPGATGRLRDALAGLGEQGLAGAHPGLRPPLDVVLVVEGAARGVEGGPTVRVEDAAKGSGDDAIVALVEDELMNDRPLIAVVTADHGLRERVTRLGAEVLGPRSLPYPAADPAAAA